MQYTWSNSRLVRGSGFIRKNRHNFDVCGLDLAEAYKVTTPLLQKHLESTVYERMSYFDNVIKAFRNTSQSSKLRKQQLNHSHKIQLSQNSAGFDGGNCVFLTNNLNKSLPKELSPYMIKSKVLKKYYQPGFPSYCHSATLIRCLDGYLLIDSGYGISRPIKLKLDGSKDSYQMGNCIWKYSLNKRQSKIIWEVFTLEGKFVESTYYRLKCAGEHIKIHNEISSQAVLVDLKPSAVFRDSCGFKTANIKIDLLKKNIKMTEMWREGKVTMIPFGDFEHFSLHKKQEHLKNYFSKDFCDRVRVEQEKFTRMVAFIVDNYDFIESKMMGGRRKSVRMILAEYMNPVKNLLDPRRLRGQRSVV